jgi:CDP-glycerol glycerophosphotransferase (TagB/SpsB family)
LIRIIRKRKLRKYLKFTEAPAGHSVLAAAKLPYRKRMAGNAMARIRSLDKPPNSPYVFFGLHFQPESSIDVWAPFFSNQMWVIELLSRAIPPTHRLLVKIHKSDATNYSREQITRMKSFAGVDIVRPFADTRAFIEGADLVVAIQGTIGLEAALLGKPVIMLGDSPVVMFPSASRIGEIADLPRLIRSKIAESPPHRTEIVEAYAAYLAPFLPASHNDWRATIDAEAIDGYAMLFSALAQYVRSRHIEMQAVS